MKKALALFLLAGFVLWILPLGYFIKPSQEKTACDGQRAMCMCHLMMPKADKPMEAGINLKTGASSSKENAGNAGNYFVSPRQALIFNLPPASIFGNQSLSYQNPFLSSLEHVPKI